jgi:teichuronic acid biosynthesis glycosyltransferase TuaC
MALNRICFIVPGYPKEDEPVYTFVKQLISSIADQGIQCQVIAPQNLTKIFFGKRKKRPFFWQDASEGNNKIDIFQPLFLSFSKLTIGRISISMMFNQIAVMRAFKKFKKKPDVLYGHFWPNGVTAGYLGEKFNIPFFVASGESRIKVKELFLDQTIHKNTKNIKGVICVSSKNLQESFDLGLAPKEKMTVIPNAINNNLFYPMDKNEVRKKLGFNESDFIVIFIGAFIHRKGVLRLSEAIQQLNDVKAIYIGAGKQKPYGDDILFSGKLPHNEIVYYLNAADVFVLPTLAEGCCNAIIEAMACGLPVISSDLPFNDDILDMHNSIRVDVNNTGQLADAIKYLRNNPNIREKMSKASLVKAKEFDIHQRARKIIDFIIENGEK